METTIVQSICETRRSDSLRVLTRILLATIVTLELDNHASWIPYVAYPLATWVGVTRELDRNHWPTDVLAGAVLGLLTAQIWHEIRRSDDDDDAQERTILRLTFPIGN